jgi:hypothetical protein
LAKDGGTEKAIVVLIGLGGYFFYNALRKYKLRQLIQNIPKSKISSVAMGNDVEVHGKVFCEPDRLIVSLLSKTRCAGYIWELHRRVGSGKNKRWELEFTYFSTPFLYVIDDSKEIAAVDLPSCEFHAESWSHIEEFHSNELSRLPPKVKETSGSFFSSEEEYLLKEKLFVLGEPLYVIGRAIPPPKHESAHTKEDDHRFGKHEVDVDIASEELFKLASKDSYVISNYDDNRNLVLDSQEQEKLMKDIRARVNAELNSGNVTSYLSRAKFLFTALDVNGYIAGFKKVYVSSSSEEDTVNNLSLHIWLGFFGAPILIVLGVWLLISQLEK